MRFTHEDRKALERILRWRRDVRHFRTDPVPGGTLEALRTAMETAPSVGNARPWRVLDVRSAARRAAVEAIFLSANEAAAEQYDGAREARYRRLKLEGLRTAPLQLAVFTARDPAAGHGLGRRTMPETLAQSTAMAVHALCLVARAANLGVGMVSILDPDAVAAALDAPADWAFSVYLCIGRPVFDDDTPLLHRVGWQENAPPAWDAR